MAIVVNTNIPSITAQRYLDQSTQNLDTSMERLASGLRINSAKDDAAGLQISNRLVAQSQGLEVAIRNANDAMSMAQTAEGAMEESTVILQRMRELSLQSANGSNGPTERKAIQQEIEALQNELNRIAETTSFGGTRLLNGTYGTQAFQIGSDAGEAIFVNLENVRADSSGMSGNTWVAGAAKSAGWVVKSAAVSFNVKAITTNKDGTKSSATISISAKPGDNIEELATYINGHDSGIASASVDENGKLQLVTAENVTLSFTGNLASSVNITGAGTKKTVKEIDVSTVGGAQMAIGLLDEAMSYIDSHRADLGAIQNRLSFATSNLANIEENVKASTSRIRDVDFAKETTDLTKYQILQQAGTSILAQAKQAPSVALSLLG